MRLRKLKKGLAILLTAAMVVGLVPDVGILQVSAETAGQTEDSSAVIVSFGELSEEVREQLLPVGANESDIIFPDTLTVTVEKTAPEEETGTGEETVSGGDAGEGTDGQIITEDITLENITWELDADNSDSDTFLSDESGNGYFYTYVPVLPETVTLTDSKGEACDFNLTLDKNVYLPEIYVLVGDSGIATFSTDGHYNENGFCNGYTFDESGNWVKKTDDEACTDSSCNGYEPATLTTDKYDIDGVDGYDNVYEITNAGQLYWFADKVNNDNANYGSANAVLTKNITVNSSLLANLNADGTAKDGYEVRSWTPIGGYYNGANVTYTGTFDGGNNNTISGLYYNVESSDRNVDAGLFGRSSGTIKNVIVKDSYFGLKYLGNFICRVGGVCGTNSGAITNCHNASNVTVTVNSNYASVGGVCGQNFPGGIIENCNNTGEVNVKGTYVGDDGGTGGVCGWNVNGTIKGCDNKGEVIGLTNVGGVCGCIRGTGTIQSCYNTAKVSGSNNVGGVCGYYFTFGADKPDGNTIESCYNTGEVSGTSYNVGGVCGWNSGYGTITDCYNEGKVSGTSYVGGVCGRNSDCGTITDCYNEGKVSGTSDVGGVCGSNSDCGTITDCYNEGEVSGTSYVGGVCGDSYAHLSDQTVTIKECYNTRKVTGKENVGGVCGMNYQGAITNSYNTGEVSGNESIGGVCGDNRVRGIVENCYNTGTVNLKEGEAESIGGVCGRNNNVTFSGTSTITNCYYDSNVYLGRAVGDNVEGGTVTNTEGKTTNQFASGSVCYLLNGSSSESPVWYQRLNTETYPNLDSTDSASRTVYQCTNCTGTYSNTENGYAEHSYIPYESDITKHICKKCGFYEAHSTTELTYTANDTTDEITVTCGECSGDLGTVTLSAPTGTLTYNGNAKEAVIYNDVNGVTILNPTITYSKTEDATFSGTPKDAGTYTASITLGTGEGAATVSVEFTIARRPVTITADNMSKTYEETDPALSFTVSEETPLVDGEVLSGELSREAGEDAGTYKITQGTVTNDTNPNYDITFSEGTFTINKAQTWGTADCVMNLVYDESSESYTATITKVDGAEYRFGESGEWSTENTLTGIAHGTEVTGYIRIAGDENHNPSTTNSLTLESGHGTLTYVERKEPDCENAGNKDYWYCESCGKYFFDGNGDTEVSKESVTIPATNHKWNQENYELDATHHWHNCQNENCPITDNSKKNGYEEHIDSNNDGSCEVCQNRIWYIISPTSMLLEKGESVSNISMDPKNGKVVVGEKVTVTTQDMLGYSFKGWYLASDIDAETKQLGDNANPQATSFTYTFKPEDNMSLVAVYEAAGNADVKISGSGFTVSVDDGVASAVQDGTYSEKLSIGSKVTITIVEENSNFINWSNENNKIVSTERTYTFTVTGQTTLTMSKKGTTGSTAMVEFVSAYNQVISGKIYSSTGTISFPDGPSKMGYTFKNWSLTQDEIQTKIKDGETHITVTPVYEQDTSRTYTVTVYVDGVQDDTQTATGILAGTTKTVNAPTVDGKVFLYWTDADGNILGYDASYFMQVNKDIVVKAVYGEAAVEAKPVIVMTNVFTTSTNGKNKISFTVTRDIPEGYTLVEHGVLYNKLGTIDNPSEETFVLGGTGVSKYTSTATKLSGIVTLNVNMTGVEDTKVVARGYMIVKNSEGKDEIYYSDYAHISYNERK